jgi:signal transduction histidine kinase/ActR/RegA family two-component response regulator
MFNEMVVPALKAPLITMWRSFLDLEQKITAYIMHNMARPAAMGKRSKEKNQLIVGGYCRLALASIVLTFVAILVSTILEEAGMIWQITLCAGTFFLSALTFCWTGSERIAGYPVIVVLYYMAYLSNRHLGLIAYIPRSQVVLHIVTFLLGGEGIIVSMLINLSVVFMMSLHEKDSTPIYYSFSQSELMNMYLGLAIHTTTLTSLMSYVNYKQTTRAIEQLEKVSAHKTEFLCRMSHELRTPLSGTIGAIDILQFAPLSEEYKSLIEIAKTCSSNLLSIINDILDLTKIEAEKMTIVKQTIDTSTLVKAATNVISPLLRQKPLEYIVEIGESVPKRFTGDFFRTKQILLNLLSNAIKFTEKGSIKLRVCVEEYYQFNGRLDKNKTFISSNTDPKQTFIKFEVSDTGVGLDKTEKDLIFSAFEQSRKGNSVQQGTGLGLNICLLLVKLMNGAIDVTSPGEKQGSTFSFWLPFTNDCTMDLPSENLTPRKQEMNFSDQTPVVQQPHLLLVEDNKVNQVILRGLLSKINCTVDIANNGMEAIEQLKTKNYPLILLDIEMPILGGIETAKRIRGDGNNVPIIALTAHAIEEQHQQALEAGMNDFLVKPCPMDKLSAVIKKHLKQR